MVSHHHIHKYKKIHLKIKNKPTFIHPSSKISSSAILEEGVSVGARSIIEHNVVIHKNVSIGKNTIVRANSVLGGHGFGFQKDQKNGWIRFPHIGELIIKDNVEIGVSNTICKGSIGETIISNGVKTDNLVHIAHNCFIGKNCILTAGVVLGGGVLIEEGCWIGLNSTIKEKIIIRKNSLVGLGSSVIKNINEEEVVAGSPAKFIRKNNQN